MQDYLKTLKRMDDLKQAIEVGDQVRMLNLLELAPLLDFKDEMEGTAMHYAAKYGQMRMVDILLSRGAAADTVDRLGFSPFLLAARYGHLDIVKRLLKLGVDMRRKTAIGMTATALADIEEHRHVVLYLHQKDQEAVSASHQIASNLQINDLHDNRKLFAKPSEDRLVFALISPSKRSRRSSILASFIHKRRR